MRELPKATALTIVGGTDAWLRVELPDGVTGYVASNTTESATRPLRSVRLSAPKKLLDTADSQAAAKKELPAGAPVQVLATANSFELVRDATGKTGWVSLE